TGKLAMFAIGLAVGYFIYKSGLIQKVTVIVEKLLNKLVENQDIELKTAPEYVIGYIVRELRNKD
ncbi:13837_t:CDS:2, partial [Gigaspora margarita]